MSAQTVHEETMPPATAPSLAYLILAHHQPAHLLRLVRALASPRAHFFVHVDGKVGLAPFERLADEPRTLLLPGRTKVYWGGFSQIQATLSLIEAARASGPNFQRFTLLSGADFPIKPRDHIENTLLFSDREFLRIDRQLSGPNRNDHFASIERHHWNDSVLFNRRMPTRHAAARFVTATALSIGSRLLPRRRFVEGLIPYHGAQWWSLSNACVHHVLSYLSAHPGYERFHHTVRVPDEIFFHSLIKASPFASRLTHDFAVDAMSGNDHGAHYIDWTTRGVSLPKVLELSDLPALLKSGALFARKFDAHRSADLLVELERRCGEPVAT